MTRRLRRFTSTLGSVAVLATLAGCGADDSSDGGGKGGALTVWLTIDARESWPDLVAGTNKRFAELHPGTEVKVQYQQWPSKNQKIDAALAGREVPDVVEMGNSETTNYIINGAFSPLEKKDFDHSEDWLPALADACQHNGKNSETITKKNSKDNIGTDAATATEVATRNSATNSATNTVTNSVGFTTTGSATGTASLNAQLALGIAATVGGSLTTSWSSRSQVSGEVPPGSRTRALVSQRRTRKEYAYEIPVTFSGLIAVRYAVPVTVLAPPQSGDYPGLDHLVARDIDDIDLTPGGFRMKGLAEVVSALEVHHTVFDAEGLTSNQQTLHKQP
ncbi:extracellular solute-binding protein [Streptomyces sp. NPDC002454]